MTEELLFLVNAEDLASAVTRGTQIATEKQHSYENEEGHLVAWAFLRLGEVTKMIDQRLEDGAEIRSILHDPAEANPRRG
jgi:hypothetical protein